MKVGETTERASHFCMASHCRFGRTTLLSKHIVSSVGGMNDGSEIGLDRTHETYVFDWVGAYCTCGCGLPRFADAVEVDSLAAMSDDECSANHEAMVAKWVAIEAMRESNHG